jgi:hypothetical protein
MSCVLNMDLNYWPAGRDDHQPEHEGGLHWRAGGGLPQQHQGQEVLPGPHDRRLPASTPGIVLGLRKYYWFWFYIFRYLICYGSLTTVDL